MALTFTERIRMPFGSQAFRVYEVVHDGSTTTIDASDVDLSYITKAMVFGTFALSAASDYEMLSGNAYGEYVTLANALTATTTFDLMVWGYGS